MFRRIKRLLRLRNKSGFTLTEVIIASALLGVLVLGVMGFATPVLSSVRSKEQNARAVLLSEAIDDYIANKIQYSFYVAAVDHAAMGDANGDLILKPYSGSEFQKQQGMGLKSLLAKYEELGGESGGYEIRCIGSRWLDVPGMSQKKLMLTNEKIASTSTGALSGEYELVFDPVFYDVLYPIIKFENYSNQYQIKNDAGEYIDQVTEEDVDIAPGLKVVTDVYISPDCYNINENIRENALLTFSGITYADLSNIRNPIINGDNTLKICPTVSLNPSYSEAYNASIEYMNGAEKVYYTDAGSTYYYPDSYLYYIAHKVKTGIY